jgi:hypothetical protein
MSWGDLHDLPNGILDLSLDGRDFMSQYWQFLKELFAYIALAALGSSVAVWILQNVFEVFYYE